MDGGALLQQLYCPQSDACITELGALPSHNSLDKIVARLFNMIFVQLFFGWTLDFFF
jgi:hypothetical protein